MNHFTIDYTNMQSNILKLDWRDVGRGLLIAVLAAVGQLVLTTIQTKGIHITTADLQAAGDLALKAAAAYLVKNLLSDENGKFLGSV